MYGIVTNIGGIFELTLVLILEVWVLSASLTKVLTKYLP